MRTRIEILKDLVFFKGDLLILQNELSQYDWDVEDHILTISKKDFTNVLNRFFEDKISFSDLVNWANIVECRDDLNFEVEELQEIVFELASPEINGEITKNKIQEIVNRIREQGSQ